MFHTGNQRHICSPYDELALMVTTPSKPVPVSPPCLAVGEHAAVAGRIVHEARLDQTVVRAFSTQSVRVAGRALVALLLSDCQCTPIASFQFGEAYHEAGRVVDVARVATVEFRRSDGTGVGRVVGYG